MIRLVLLLAILGMLSGCAAFRNDLQSYQEDLPKYKYKILPEQPYDNQGPAYAKYVDHIKQEVVVVPLRKAATFEEGEGDRIKVRFDGGVVLTFEWVNSKRKYYLVDEPITLNGVTYKCDWDSVTYAKWTDPETGKNFRKKLAPNLKYYLGAYKLKQGELIEKNETNDQKVAFQHYTVNEEMN